MTPEFKGNLIARYNFDIGSMRGVRAGRRWCTWASASRTCASSSARSSATWPSYTVADFSAGISQGQLGAQHVYVNNVFDERADISRFTNCAETVCGASASCRSIPNGQVYTVTNQPRTLGIRWSQEF